MNALTSRVQSDRRLFLKRSAIATVAALGTAAYSASSAPQATATPIPASPLPQVTGQPTVYLDLTQEQLDRAYTQAAWAPTSESIITAYKTDSARVREAMPPRVFSYGPTQAETLDAYIPTGGAAAKPIVVFIHGGAWRSLSKQDSAFPAPTFTNQDMCFVALDFALLPQVRLPDMADQIRRALAWIYGNSVQMSGDPNRIHIIGHSSGGHLAAVALTTDWTKYGLPPGASPIRSGTCLSGIYDLYPVLLSSRGDYVKVSADEADSLSPLLGVENIMCPVIVVHGDRESPEFIRQSTVFSSTLRRRPNQYIVARDSNHFQVPTRLADPQAPMTAAILKQASS